MGIEGYADFTCYPEDPEEVSPDESEECYRVYYSSWAENGGLVLYKVLHRDTDKEERTVIARCSAEELEKAAHILKIIEER